MLPRLFIRSSRSYMYIWHIALIKLFINEKEKSFMTVQIRDQEQNKSNIVLDTLFTLQY